MVNQLFVCPRLNYAASNADRAAPRGKSRAATAGLDTETNSLPAALEKRTAGIANGGAGMGKCSARVARLNETIKFLPARSEIGLPAAAAGLPGWKIIVPELENRMPGSKNDLPGSPDGVPEAAVEMPQVKTRGPEPTYRRWEVRICLPQSKAGLPALKTGCQKPKMYCRRGEKIRFVL